MDEQVSTEDINTSAPEYWEKFHQDHPELKSEKKEVKKAKKVAKKGKK